ncbi:MAG: hypothetical protein EAY75_09575 [Bacteroidetes bacterium]|nr:MAG: hypothetical protein EAY75_09575 [Bacteroidota bacterium]
MQAKLLPDGKIVLVASSFFPTPTVVAIRLTENGLFDNSFDTDGLVVLNSFFQYASAIETEPNGKIVILGTDGSNDSRLLRLNANGSVDNTLGGSNGLLLEVDLGYSNNYFEGFKRVNATQYLVFGSGNIPNSNEQGNFLAKITNVGGLVNGFGTGGRVVLNTMETDDRSERITDVVLLADGKILVGTSGNDEAEEDVFNAYF